MVIRSDDSGFESRALIYVESLGGYFFLRRFIFDSLNPMEYIPYHEAMFQSLPEPIRSRDKIVLSGLVDYTPEHGREIVIYDTYDKDHVTEEIIETVKRLVWERI
jgi:hypothetical protein